MDAQLKNKKSKVKVGAQKGDRSLSLWSVGLEWRCQLEAAEERVGEYCQPFLTGKGNRIINFLLNIYSVGLH
jgi:hypothetical protein